jgi:hypothetical protein
MDLYETCISWSICTYQVLAWKAESLVSKYGLFVQSGFYWSAHVGDWCAIMWHDCTWVGGGRCPPPPDEVMHVRPPFFIRGLTSKGLNLLAWQYIHIGRGRWSCAVFWPDFMAGGIWMAPLQLTGSCTHGTICPLKTKYSMQGDVACMTHLAWAGVFTSSPWLGHAGIRMFYWPTWAWLDVERPRSMTIAI